MLRPALVVGVVLSTTAGAAPRAGRVVRIDREQGRPTGTPRLCQVSTNDMVAYCVGQKPEPGDTLTVIDSKHVVAILRVDQATATGPCAQAPMWALQVRLVTGDIAPGAAEPETMGLIDAGLDPHNAHLVKLEHAPGDRPVTSDNVWAIDGNGDGTPDLVFVKSQCNEANAPTASATSTGTCFEVWYAVGHRFELLRTDRIPASCF